MELIFLGTGASFPTKERNVSSMAVRLGGEVVLFDCGEGTQRQLAFSSVSFMKISHIFITHYHGDHFLGLPGLIQTMGLNERKHDLHIYGTKGTEEYLEGFLGTGNGNREYNLYLHDLEPGDVVETDTFTVKTVEANHGYPALCYSLQEPGKRGKFNRAKAVELGVPAGRLFKKLIAGENVEVNGKVVTPDEVMGPPRQGLKMVFTGDTAPFDGLVELSQDADVLVHEATFADDTSDKANSFGHSTSRDAATTAKDANAKRLILTHISPRYKEEGRLEALLSEAKEVFENVEVAFDLDSFTITR